MQLWAWLLGIGSTLWQRVLVSSGFTLRALHRVFQVAMGWKDIHLCPFFRRARLYGSWEQASKGRTPLHHSA